MVSVSSEEQLLKAQLPRMVTELGMLTARREVQPSKATLPMMPMLEPNWAVTRPLQP